MKFKKCLLPVAMLASFTLAGCQSNADDHAADVYQTDQLNTKQETKTVNIISILPAKVAVDNSQNKRNAQAFGALIGAVAGGVIGHNVGSGSNSGTTAGAVGGGAVQVGKECQFTTGLAVVITTTYNETRIQPNTKCPEKS
ncbi:putative lipoprotein [Escherichia coli]|nr:putative lipoprotein [Escherichia coli]